MSCCDETKNTVVGPKPQQVNVTVGFVDLQSLAHTLPPADGIARHFERPMFLSDGSIEYPPSQRPPPDINGYERDPKNHCLFKPLWNECGARMHGTKTKRSGAINVVMICNNPQATDYTKYLTHEQCLNCPVRKTRP